MPDLSDPSLAIIFATSPTGLGHLRVTEALYHGLPPTASPILLGSKDPLISATYRFVSIHSLTRRLMELLQAPPMDKLFALISRKLIRSQTNLLYQELKTILNERFTVPKTVLLIATHAILGHELGAIKMKLEKEMNVKVLLVVQVTDDSPQPVWYVYDANLIMVPSHYTKEHLTEYAKKSKLPAVPITVAAYPISLSLAEKLPESFFNERLRQTNPESSGKVFMTVPISGAAVGTTFTSDYIKALHKLSERFEFHVVSRQAPFTTQFIQTVSKLPYVKLYTSIHDRETVGNYEHVLTHMPITFELTKPSEQAFKALLNPKERGGVVMLFSEPVGEQEYDNLHFLRNHGLMPGKDDHFLLWGLAEKGASIPKELLAKAHHWRALRLPKGSARASAFTLWCMKENIFSTMMHYEHTHQGEEVRSNGVQQFWTHVTQLVK